MTHVVRLASPMARRRAMELVMKAPDGFVATIAEPKRTLEQNDKLWAMLTDVSVTMPQGRRHTPDDWKSIFMSACGWECQFLEGLDGRPFPQGFRSSKLTKTQMSALIDFIDAWGSENGVRWTYEEKDAA
jgi:hypothetical protein